MGLSLLLWAACSLVIYGGIRWRERRNRKPEPVVVMGSFCPKCADLADSQTRFPDAYRFQIYDARKCRRDHHAHDRISLPADFLGPVNGCACRSCAVTRRAKVPEIVPSQA